MGKATPSLLASVIHFGLYNLICLVATCIHITKQLIPTQKIFKNDDNPEKRCRVVVITGCDSGFGRMLALQMLSNKGNYIVVALCLTKSAVAELQEEGLEHSMVCDVTSQGDVTKMRIFVQDLLQKNKSEDLVLDTLVNNAGMVDPGDFVFFSEGNLDAHRRVMEVNYFGTLRVTQALLPLMISIENKGHHSRIINVSSVCGAVAIAGSSSYSASKFAIEAWSDSLRIELESPNFNISVVKVRPGITNTKIQTDYVDLFLQNYNMAPKEVRELYGGDVFAKAFRDSLDKAKGMRADPNKVVDALEDMVTMKASKLKPFYWVGDDAHTIFRAFQALSAATAFALKQLIMAHPPLVATIPRPKHFVISHMTIRVRDLSRSLPFYQAFGFEPFGPTTLDGQQQFLQQGKSSKDLKKTWSPLILLKQDPNMPNQGRIYDAGMPQLCLYTHDINAQMDLLANKHGIHPMAPDTIQVKTQGVKTSHIVVYKDPDGFLVECRQIEGLIDKTLRKAARWTTKQDPSMFSCVVNTTNIARVKEIFSKIGFITQSDQTNSQVLADLPPSFHLDPKTTELEHVRVIMLKRDTMRLVLRQWNKPRTTLAGCQLNNALCIAVPNIEQALDEAKAAGFMVKPNAIEIRHLPAYGPVRMATVYVEEWNGVIEFVSFAR